MFSRSPILALLALLIALPVSAQPSFLKNLAEEATGGGARRNDLEGGIWEYKVRARSGDKRTVLVGKVRIKNSAAFDVAGSAKGELLTEATDEPEETGTFPFGIRPPAPPNTGVLDRLTESNRGGDRIADVTYEKSRNSTSATPKVTFQFDTDDEHPLSGEAQVKYDTRNGGGVWRGSYYERLEDGKKKRWTFELRFIED